MIVSRRHTYLILFSEMSASVYGSSFLILLVASLLHISFAIHNDRFSLLAFKSNILQDPYGFMSSWNDSIPFCQWQGVTCGHRHRRVTVLDISSGGLVGSLSPLIENLSFLRVINLQNNSLHGEIPAQIGRLFRLEALRLHNNTLEGRIPSNISGCVNLRSLNLLNNKLGGEIPRELGALSKLGNLFLSANFLTGKIPQSLGNLTSLQSLSLGQNELEGSIPDVLVALRKLTALGIGLNKLSGTVPSSIYNLSSLTILSLAFNQLHGSLPQDLGSSFPHLQRLEMEGNQFSGSLPLSLSNASQLERIILSNNSFSGRVPTDLGRLEQLRIFNLDLNFLGRRQEDDMSFVSSMVNCTELINFSVDANRLGGILTNIVGNLSAQLRFFGVGGNEISGVVPPEIGNLVNLEILVLEDNGFGGRIPESIGRITKLQQLIFSNNQLIGQVPNSLGNLTFLSQLYIEMNSLDGSIPSSLGNCQYLITLNLSRNNLNGIIPKELFSASALSISLNLAKNRLVGALPSEVGNLKNLIELEISDNRLSGEVPASLGDCEALVSLYMGGNLFQGSIPPSWASLRGIEYLDLSHNNFSGLVPDFLENLSLKQLNLSFNNFEGDVPSKGVFTDATAISVVGNSKLCGGIFELRLPKCKTKGLKERKSRNMHVIAILVPCVVGVIAILSSFIFFWVRRTKTEQSSGSSIKEGILKVSYEDLLKATDAFSPTNLIGVGGFGTVYKGCLGPSGTVVAIKVLNLQHRGASKSFVTECEALKNIRHRNLVKIITSCSSIDFQGNEFKALVYEYMSSGSLESWLHTSHEADSPRGEPKNLDIHQRVSIAIDVAFALDYLHNQCEIPIIHCDLKPSNVLLDSDMVAHVGDFGIARFLLPEASIANQSSSIGIRGTIGYVAPEYGMGNEVSTKADVYSYGILLLEMVTGRSPLDPMFKEGLNLHNFAQKSLPDHVMQIVDPVLLRNIGINDQAVSSSTNGSEKAGYKTRIEKCFIAIVRTGLACTLELPQERWDINRVIHELHSVRHILQVAQNGSQNL